MQLTLRNIGIVGDATIKLNGLTVVTGANNSGKTTVGRAIYSLVSAVENLQRNVVHDKLAYAQSTIANLLDPTFFRLLPVEGDASIGDERIASLEGIIGLIDQIVEKVGTAEKSLFEQNLKPMDIPPRVLDKVFQDFIKQRPSIIENLKSLRNAMLKDPECFEYISKRIEKKFNTEFFSQILPLSVSTDGKSYCSLTKDGANVFNVALGRDANKVDYTLSANPFSNAFFLDDVTVIDELAEKRERYVRRSRVFGNRFRYSRLMTNNKDFLGSFSVEGHKDDLIRSLLATQDTITGELAVEKNAAVIMERIREAISFGVEWRDGRFVSSDFKIDLHNLAQGSKAFLVVKLLLENGSLRKDSLLVLDEPETRLHPEWQGLFAEVVILLVEHLGCTVVLTTHSPDFVIALDVASREHRINDKTTFYISRKLENGLVTFDEVDDKNGGKTMNDVYLHLSKPFMRFESRRLELISIEPENDGASK